MKFNFQTGSQSIINSILRDGTLLKIFTKHVGDKIGKSLLPVEN